MTRTPAKPISDLRRGWTTGACATAAVQAALGGLWGEGIPARVGITLPKGETPEFDVVRAETGDGWAQAGIVKDAGDDPDVTHGAVVLARVEASSGGVVFRAGEGVGTVTKAGLPIAVGEAAINPVPRAMMDEEVAAAAIAHGRSPDVMITISVPNGAEIAKKTWNPRLGIKGGLSILGTTGIVRPFSCAAWIASIHRGIDVARADGLTHVAGCTGNTSERVVQSLLGLPDHAMLDMGDFAGGLLKYLARAPEGQSIQHVTIGGGIGKLTKLAQGAIDLHSGRSQVDFEELATRFARPDVARANTALAVYETLGAAFAQDTAARAKTAAERLLEGAGVAASVVVIDRAGKVIGQA
ncbi:cobalt-precorrin-5B (C(1))-methyltransferase [Pseudooctadecabacter jejudonensis]|uniref:Cobalt-precorrin-5B C(1)-methyltransferase n=1 Tax=Pseudooctadecabacter jejudonensis TaxID=1391910 RepID=A0A1Y5RCZ7_9RHOB|nr:cobalt-precorrin-5B (C(1))-methyltransferase [Pseudooctadecabacter jejudonensis]SLN14586.1 cobalt-precorrin-6A synthase [Pseudooctadecabacter jejudonensis]